MAPFKDPIFYVPANGNRAPETIDCAVLNANGYYVGEFSGETLEQIAKRYPGAAIGEMDEVIAVKEKLQTTEPIEIDKDTFIDALEMLPPENWVQCGGLESFKCCEYLSGRITAIYARIGERYFTFNGLGSTPHVSVIEKVTAHLSRQVSTPA